MNSRQPTANLADLRFDRPFAFASFCTRTSDKGISQRGAFLRSRTSRGNFRLPCVLEARNVPAEEGAFEPEHGNEEPVGPGELLGEVRESPGDEGLESRQCARRDTVAPE